MLRRLKHEMHGTRSNHIYFTFGLHMYPWHCCRMWANQNWNTWSGECREERRRRRKKWFYITGIACRTPLHAARYIFLNLLICQSFFILSSESVILSQRKSIFVIVCDASRLGNLSCAIVLSSKKICIFIPCRTPRMQCQGDEFIDTNSYECTECTHSRARTEHERQTKYNAENEQQTDANARTFRCPSTTLRKPVYIKFIRNWMQQHTCSKHSTCFCLLFPFFSSFFANQTIRRHYYAVYANPYSHR